MKAPQEIERKNHKYILVKQINEKIWLYQEKNVGFYECFSNYDLGMVSNKIKSYNLKPDNIIFY